MALLSSDAGASKYVGDPEAIGSQKCQGICGIICRLRSWCPALDNTIPSVLVLSVMTIENHLHFCSSGWCRRHADVSDEPFERGGLVGRLTAGNFELALPTACHVLMNGRDQLLSGREVVDEPSTGIASCCRDGIEGDGGNPVRLDDIDRGVQNYGPFALSHLAPLSLE